jgi:two-component system, OmpR family, phosphate regulon sensor histidine kinase PhoR
MRPFLAGLILLIGLVALGRTGASALTVAAAALAGLIMLIALWPREREDEREAPDQIAAPIPRHNNLIEAFGDPVFITGDGRIEEANAPARKLLGQHIVGEDVRVAIRHPAAAERLISRGEPFDFRPIELVGLGGRETRWQMNVAALQDGRMLVHLVDRSEGHAAERMRVDFVANASHELRTPLAAILGFVETLDDDKAGGDASTRKRFLRVMHDEARRMQRLVEDLMSLSRIEAEKFRAPDAAVDLAELVKEVHAVIRDGSDDRSRDVIIDLDESLPFVAGDRAQLSQLLHNLVSNSMKYGRPGTPVSVRTSRGPGSMVRLSVEDEGDGVPPEHLPRLTERFYRADPSRSRSQGGTGLGLAIVKHIVERHRGRLDIQSTPGKGTTVSALLPPAPIPLSSNGNAVVTGAG